MFAVRKLFVLVSVIAEAHFYHDTIEKKYLARVLYIDPLSITGYSGETWLDDTNLSSLEEKVIKIITYNHKTGFRRDFYYL